MGVSATPVTPARLDRAESAHEAYKRVEARIIGMRAEAVGRVTADPPIAASIALGALVNLKQLESDFEQLGDGGRALAALNDLEDLALAALYADIQYQNAIDSKELGPLLERARVVREDLLGLAESLARLKFFAPQAVAQIREGSGSLDTAKDIINLAALYSSNWDRLIGKIPLELAVVEEAGRLGLQLLRAIGASEVGEVRRDPSFDWEALRARAFRLLVLAYEELRRAATYVRWFHADAKAFAPSLHARSVAPAAKPAPAPAQPPTTDDLPSAEQAAGTTPPVSGVAPGLKGGSPFAAE